MKILLKLIVIFIVIGGLILVFSNRFTCKEYIDDYLKPMKINSLVYNRYLDKNHAYRRIEIIVDNKVQKIHLSHCVENLYDLLMINDSISKKQDKNEIEIYRNGSLLTNYKY